jgi:hypothetical protein
MPQYCRYVFTGMLLGALLVNVSGCDDGSKNAATSNSGATDGRDAPLITGAAPTTVVAGETYKFQPMVAAPAESALDFSITHQPSWAKFDRTTGALTGSPAPTDAGEFPDIVIAVDDGVGTAALAPFSIRVASGSSAVATITWTAAAAGGGGSTAQDADGYRVYYGTSVAGMTHVVTIADPSETSYVVENLSPGTWFFAIASYDRNSAQSVLSPTVSVTL